MILNSEQIEEGKADAVVDLPSDAVCSKSAVHVFVSDSLHARILTLHLVSEHPVCEELLYKVQVLNQHYDRDFLAKNAIVESMFFVLLRFVTELDYLVQDEDLHTHVKGIEHIHNKE